ncbi:hypothetical protein HA402_002873 [Bradysia odoriphaga]|nr:hypothetical protein HA402_002873 [Bradysia odoriphaga]
MSDSTKNNAISDAVREKGNKCFCKKEYFDALRLYNEALRYAEGDSKQMGLAYANRSAVFLKVKLYKACFKNIQLAKDHNFPQERLSKLISRENECMASMNAPMEEAWNGFFKLSYQPNPSFPYLVDCLELKEHERGTYLSTKRDLKAGDIIAITEPLFRIPIRSVYRCNYCLADQFMNFIPCSGCVDVMFCNEICMKKAFAEFHQFECGITDNPSIPKSCWTILRMIMKCLSICDGSSKQVTELLPSTMNRLITPFDFQLNDPLSVSSQKKLLLSHFSKSQRFDYVDNTHSDEVYSDVQPFLRRHPKLQQIVTSDLLKNCVNLVDCSDMKIFKSVDSRVLSEVNSYTGLCVNYFGGAIESCYNLFLHSCAPTVFLHPYNGKIVWIVLTPIKAGDWLTVAYQNAFFSEKSREDRKAELPNVLCCCKCVACTRNWKPLSMATLAPFYVLSRSSEDGITAYKKYCDEMNSKPLDDKCNDALWYTIGLFRWNLCSIGRATF